MPCAHILVDTQGRTNMSNDSDSVLMIDHDIWWYGKMDHHISPFRSEQLQPASYDVRLSDRLLAYSGDGWIDAETRVLVGDITYDEIHIDGCKAKVSRKLRRLKKFLHTMASSNAV